jgi:hypothetical protein
MEESKEEEEEEEEEVNAERDTCVGGKIRRRRRRRRTSMEEGGRFKAKTEVPIHPPSQMPTQDTPKAETASLKGRQFRVSGGSTVRARQCTPQRVPLTIKTPNGTNF